MSDASAHTDNASRILVNASQSAFPNVRMRRNRFDAWTRRLVAEHKLSIDDLIWPVFVRDGSGQREPIATMPGVDRLSIDLLVQATGAAADLGIACAALLPYVDPARRDAEGSEAVGPDNIVCRAVRAIKESHPGLGVLCAVALDPYTIDGHDGMLRAGHIAN